MSSAGCLQLKSRKSTNYCPVTGNLLPRTPAEPPFLFTGTIETKRSVTTLPCDTHECRRTIVFVAISLRHPACIWFNAYEQPTSLELAGVGHNRRKSASCDET